MGSDLIDSMDRLQLIEALLGFFFFFFFLVFDNAYLTYLGKVPNVHHS